MPSSGAIQSWSIDVPICRTCQAEIAAAPRAASRVALFLLPLPVALWTYVCPRWNQPAHGEILPVLLAFAALGLSAIVVFSFFLGLWIRQAKISRAASPDGAGRLRFGNADYQARFDVLNPPSA